MKQSIALARRLKLSCQVSGKGTTFIIELWTQLSATLNAPQLDNSEAHQTALPQAKYTFRYSAQSYQSRLTAPKSSSKGRLVKKQIS
jgi:hypothetical protein